MTPWNACKSTRRSKLLTIAAGFIALGSAGCGGTAGTASGDRPAVSGQSGAPGNSVDFANGTPIGFAAVSPGTTGGQGGAAVSATTAADLLGYLHRPEAYVIQVAGTVALPPGMHSVAANKTLLGAGAGAKITKGGLNLSGVSNIVIRNIAFEGQTDDAINLQDGTHHVWLDHNSFANAYDGLVDIKRESSFVTVSWNVFRNHNKTSLVGHDDGHTVDAGKLKVTYHHNWFQSDSRLPRVRFGEVHVFNNFYDGVKSYAIASTMDAAVVVEANYFRNVRRPALVGYEESGPGDLVERGNVYESSGAPETRGTAFEPSTYYEYHLDDAGTVPGLVRNGAGAGKL